MTESGSPRWWRRFAHADFRVLAIFRIALAFVLLVDLGSRAQEMLLHYSDLGLVSAHFAIAAKLEALQPTYLFGIRWPYLVKGFFAFTAASYVALALGWQTRISTFLALLCTLSIHSRNFMIGHAGDALSHALLAWALFLPLGARWSIDDYLRRRPGPARVLTHYDRRLLAQSGTTSVAVLGLRVEMVAFFVLNGLAKSGATWADGSAWHHILWLDSMARSPAAFAREHLPDGLFVAATYLHPWVEILGGLALLAAFVWVRRGALVALASLWLGIGMFVQQGSLPALVLVGLVIFLREDELLRWPDEPPRSPSERPPHRIEGVAVIARECLAALFLLAALASMSARNASLPDALRMKTAPAWSEVFNEPLMLAHAWGAFAPDPPTVDGRFVLIGRTRSGEWVEVVRGGDRQAGLERAMGSERSMQDLAFDVRLRLGWLETMKPELARFCWNAHLLASSGADEPLVECRGLLYERPNPALGSDQPPALQAPRVVFAARHRESFQDKAAQSSP